MRLVSRIPLHGHGSAVPLRGRDRGGGRRRRVPRAGGHKPAPTVGFVHSAARARQRRGQAAAGFPGGRAQGPPLRSGSRIPLPCPYMAGIGDGRRGRIPWPRPLAYGFNQ